MAYKYLSPQAFPVRAALLLALALPLAACKDDATPLSAAAPQAVETMTVALEPAARTWSYAGLVRPRYQSDLGFRVGGKLVERLVDVGSSVKTGDVLARLEPTDFKLAIAADEAEVRAAGIAQTEAAAALERFRVLFDEGHVSKAALDQRVSAAAEAKSRVERAERNLELARNQLSYATLISDADGIVTALPAEVGQVVTAGQLVLRIARLDAVEAEAALPEQDLEAVRNAKAEVELWGESSTRVPARLREVSPDADAVSRTFRARFALEGPNVTPVFGRTATIHLSATTQGNVAVLPISAVANTGSGPVAWVVSNDGTRANPTPISIAAIEKDRVLVTKGLKAGDRVVTLGVHMLDPEKPIRPVETRALISQK